MQNRIDTLKNIIIDSHGRAFKAQQATASLLLADITNLEILGFKKQIKEATSLKQLKFVLSLTISVLENISELNHTADVTTVTQNTTPNTISLCKVLNDTIVKSLKSGTGSKYTFIDQVWAFIQNETNTLNYNYCSCVELAKSLYYDNTDHRLPLYGYNGDVSMLHHETRALIKLGFVYIDQYCLCLDKELIINLERLEFKADHMESVRAYNRMMASL